MRASALSWSKPFYGVQHLGNLGDAYRVSVEDWGTFAVLTMWTRGDGFRAPQRQFDTAEEARQSGERWLRDRNAL